MKNRFKLLLILFISILCINVNAEKIEVLVGNKWLKESDNIIIDDKGGRAILDVDTNTLTLENFTYNGKGAYIEENVGNVDQFYSALGNISGNLTIILKGTNTFNYQPVEELSRQVFSFFGGKTEIKGSGSLIFNSSGTTVDGSCVFGIDYADKLDIIDADLSINIGYGAIVMGLYGEDDVSVISSNFDIKHIGSGAMEFIAILCEKISLKNSNVDISANSSLMGTNSGIEASNTLINNSKLSISLGSGGSGTSAAFKCDDVEILESKANIVTDTVAFFTEDNLVLNKSVLKIKAQGGILKYDEDGPNGSVTVGTISAKASDDYYLTIPASDFGDTDLKELKNKQYYETSVETNSSNAIYTLEKNGVNVITENIVDKMNLSDLDMLNRNFGQNIYIQLTVSDDYDKTDDEIINNNLGKYTVGKVMDIGLVKFIGLSGEYDSITELNSEIQLSIDVPEELQKNNRNFKLINVHDGVANIINPVSYDKTTGRLVFETKQFSTYALIYSDEVNPQTGDNICYFITLMILSIMGIVIGFKLERRY